MKYLSVEDALLVVDVIVDMLPEAGETSVRSGLLCAYRHWPNSYWNSVIDRLNRDGVNERVAMWLQDEIVRERARLERVAK